MAEYHVGCGLGGIYAGTLKPNGIEWRNKTRVTDEALAAVADYLMFQMKEGEYSFGYEWTLKNGGKVKLFAEVEPPKGAEEWPRTSQ